MLPRVVRLAGWRAGMPPNCYAAGEAVDGLTCWERAGLETFPGRAPGSNGGMPRTGDGQGRAILPPPGLAGGQAGTSLFIWIWGLVGVRAGASPGAFGG